MDIRKQVKVYKGKRGQTVTYSPKRGVKEAIKKMDT